MNTNYSFREGKICPRCAKIHKTSVKETRVKSGAVRELPELIRKYGGARAFVVADVNTYAAGGERVVKILEAAGIPASEYVFADRKLEPDEKALGALLMHYDRSCDVIVAVGSGVINDLCKILADFTGNTYVVVATAASMDGYASANSSVIRAGLKVTLASKAPDVIVGDTDILNAAPPDMAKAGLGDMIAKYISICEWQLSNLINGEDYCEEVAAYTRSVREACIAAADGIAAGDADAIANVFCGLVAAGNSMAFVGGSRPCGGAEHYFSHLWDMRGLEFGTSTSSHGVQTAVGTVYCLKAFEALRRITPNRERALRYARDFDFGAWSEMLTKFLGKGADAMIALEAREGKYDLDKHRARLEIIIDKWDGIIKIIDEELPSSAEIERLLESIGAPRSIEDIGLEKSILPMTLMATKDIRDKYILSRLLWDLGILEEVAEEIAK